MFALCRYVFLIAVLFCFVDAQKNACKAPSQTLAGTSSDEREGNVFLMIFFVKGQTTADNYPDEKYKGDLCIMRPKKEYCLGVGGHDVLKKKNNLKEKVCIMTENTEYCGGRDKK